MIRKFLTAAVAAVAAVVAAPATSQAVFTLTVGAVTTTDVVGPVVPGVGDQNGAFRQITLPSPVISGPFNAGEIAATAFESAAFSNVIQSTNTLTNTGATAATITITALEDNFLLPLGSTLSVVQQLSLNNAFSTTGATIPGGGLVSLVATSTVEGVSVVSQLLNQPGTLATDVDTGSVPRVGPISVQNSVQVTLAAGATVTFQNFVTITGVVDVIPVPAGLVMAATAVPFLGLIRRRLRGASAPVAA